MLSLKFRLQMVTGIQHLQTVMRSPMDQNYHKRISKRSKTIQPVIKLRCAMTTQGARAHAHPETHEKRTCARCTTVVAKSRAHLRTMHL
jgi:hypothetical protein